MASKMVVMARDPLSSLPVAMVLHMVTSAISTATRIAFIPSQLPQLISRASTLFILKHVLQISSWLTAQEAAIILYDYVHFLSFPSFVDQIKRLLLIKESLHVPPPTVVLRPQRQMPLGSLLLHFLFGISSGSRIHG